ncbi:MAG: hypothetical protein D6767_10650, partial [Candidatus Hydrogenedentota bacterium]
DNMASVILFHGKGKHMRLGGNIHVPPSQDAKSRQSRFLLSPRHQIFNLVTDGSTSLYREGWPKFPPTLFTENC